MSTAVLPTLVWALIVIIVVIILVIVLFKVLSYLVVLPEVYGQENGTNTIATFQGTEGRVTSSLQFIPQQAYIQTVAPSGVQNSNSNNPQGLSEILVSLAASGGAFVLAKLNADKNHKANAAEILKAKENTKELARVTYDMNPEAADKIDDAPSIKIQTLTEDVNAYAEKVTKK